MLRTTMLLLGSLAMLWGCSGNPPVIDYDSSANFASYRSYAFISEHPLMRGESVGPGSPLLEGRLMRVTDELMAQRGFTKMDDPDSADIAICFTVGSRD